MKSAQRRLLAIERALVGDGSHLLHRLPDAFADGAAAVRWLAHQGACDRCVRGMGSVLSDEQRAFVLQVIAVAVEQLTDTRPAT